MVGTLARVCTINGLFSAQCAKESLFLLTLDDRRGLL